MSAVLNRSWVNAICNVFLKCSELFAKESVCYLIYGEPEYPTED